MKNYFNLILLTGTFLFSSVHSEASEDLSKKPIAPFHIKSREKVSTVSEGKTKFKFTFQHDRTPLVKNVAIGFNDSSLYIRSNKSGEISTTIDAGKYVMYFYIEGYEEVITDTIEVHSQELIEAEINFQTAGEIITVDKPVIYVYPEKEMPVNIQLNVTGTLSFTYPQYNNGWSFTASPDGNIVFNEKEYGYLFWDSKMDASKLSIDQTGFLVSSDTLLSFLENNLEQMGLNSKESADFITYWYPRMQENEKNYVHFLFNEACDAYAELNITPKPDHIFRVGMVWSKTNSDIMPEPQIISSANRTGFTVIEWGGTEVPHLFNLAE